MNSKAKNIIILLTGILIFSCNNPFFPEKGDGGRARSAIQAYYTVSFEANGGTPAPGNQLIAKDGKIAKLPIMVRENFGFGGWFSDRRLTIPWNFETDTVDSNITLYAKWDQPSIEVIFVEDGGNPPLVHSTIRVLSGTKIPEPATLTKSGWGFAGWWTNDGTGGDWGYMWDFAVDIAGRDKDTAGMDPIILTARWAIPEYRIIFQAYGGDPPPRDQVLAAGTKIKEPLAMHRAGYGFGGWFIDGDLSVDPGTGTIFLKPWNFNEIPTKDLTLYARWVTEYFTVRFDINGGDLPEPGNEEIEKGAKIIRPPGVPTRADYGFGGWYDRATGREWNFDIDTISADTTLYARWDLNHYTVTFDSITGTTLPLPPDQYIAHGSKAIEPRAVERTVGSNIIYSVLERPGYHFAGWYTEEDYPDGREWDFDTDTVRADMTLYARWVPVDPGWVWVRGGSYMMGDDTITGSKPAHRVTVSGFYMATREVVQADYLARMGVNPSARHSNPATLPVERVSWFDAIEYANKYTDFIGNLTPVYNVNGNTDPILWGGPFNAQVDNNITGQRLQREADFNAWANTYQITMDSEATGFRLPTEAEWEYAAKGGRDAPRNFIYSGSDNPDTVAYYNISSGRDLKPVGELAPNTLGIYDMSGNLMEWCWDWFNSTYYSNSPLSNPRGPTSGTERVRRGGSWNNAITNIRPPVRASNPPATIDGGWVNGIRLVRGNVIPRWDTDN